MTTTMIDKRLNSIVSSAGFKVESRVSSESASDVKRLLRALEACNTRYDEAYDGWLLSFPNVMPFIEFSGVMSKDIIDASKQAFHAGKLSKKFVGHTSIFIFTFSSYNIFFSALANSKKDLLEKIVSFNNKQAQETLEGFYEAAGV
jgi:hypothetical protein